MMLPTAANERTFLAWLSMATTVGGISTALAGYTSSVEKIPGEFSRLLLLLQKYVLLPA